MSWREAVRTDPTDWLLEPSDPSVRFWALKDIEGREASDPEVEESQDELMGSGPVKAILSAQHADGYWVRPDDMYLPKYRASTHSLLILAELGAKRTPRIECAIEHMYKFQRDSGHFLTNLPKTDRGRASTVTDGCCLDGNILYYLNHFGYLDDPRTRRLLDFLVADHSKVAGGWRCRAYPIDPNAVFPVNCYMGAMKPLRALAAIPEEKRPLEVRAVIEGEVEKILDNRIYLYRRNPDGSRKEKAGWKRFGFPLFYQSDVLEVLDTLTRLGVRNERMQGSIDLVLAAQQKDGRWFLKNTFNGKMWVDIEEKHRPSKWITLRALRVLKRYYED
jgi:hypothetical protein